MQLTNTTHKKTLGAMCLAAVAVALVGCASGGGTSAMKAESKPAKAVAANPNVVSFKPVSGPINHPADLLGGLKRWHLTLPTSKDKKAFPADQINQPELATFSSDYFKFNSDKTGVLMTTNMGGATTSAGTAFARTELRERAEDGGMAAWDCAKDVRSMSIRQRILKTPTHKVEMSVGQIHDAKSDNLEVFYKGPKKNVTGGIGDVGSMLAKFNGMSSSKAPVLDDDYRVGDMMQVKISTKDGVMTVDYKNERSGKVMKHSAKMDPITGGCYFKAGNYHQACTKINMYGVENPNCSKKTYTPDRFETDPNATSVVELFGLSLD